MQKSKKLKYINAGHYPPILCMGENLRRLNKGCTVIGAFEKMPFIEEETIDLEKESLILTFTDGLTELKNERDEYLQDEQIEKFVCENKNASVDDFNERLLNEIDKFKGSKNYGDDIAILNCKIN